MYLALKEESEKESKNQLTVHEDFVKTDTKIIEEPLSKKGISGTDIAFWLQLQEMKNQKPPSS
jgi:hypothetical protein